MVGLSERMRTGDHLISTIVASILALVIVAPASGQEIETSGPSATPPGAAPSVSSRPAPEPSAEALVHHRVGRLGLDVPAEWTVRPADVLMRSTHVIEFIGTAPSTAGCTTDGDLTRCGVDLALEPGTVSVAVEEPGGPVRIDTPFERAEDPPPGTTVVEIDGVPAFLTREADAIELFVPAPDDIFGGTRFRAGVRGPGEAAIWQQVEDLLASVHYEPPLQPTDRLGEEAAAAAARAVVEHKASQDGAYACFPRTPGRSRHAVVRRLPGYSRLHRRLPVTCSTEIQGTPLEVWKMTLTSSWTDGPGRSAGSVAETVWIGPDGDYTTTSRGGDPPYWP